MIAAEPAKTRDSRSGDKDAVLKFSFGELEKGDWRGNAVSDWNDVGWNGMQIQQMCDFNKRMIST